MAGGPTLKGMDTDSRPTISSPATEAPKPGTAPGVEELLEDHQLELYLALSERSEKAGGWYRGALIALANRADPERFVHAAHSLRELMEKLPKLIDVPAPRDPVSMKSKLRALGEIWEKRRRLTSCHKDGDWHGPIDTHLRAGLIAVDETIEWLRTLPTFKESALVLIRELDVSKRLLPPSIEREHYKEWRDLNDYFQAVAHHLHDTNDTEFGARLYAFESFILDKIRPSTAADQKVLDDIIAEAERGT
jgi:hypothetical protein